MSYLPLQLGLIGYPLGHSLSPQLHHAALKAMGLPGLYRLYPIPPLPEGKTPLVELVGRLRSGEMAGLNVTIPHKQNVLPLLDDLSPLARRTGSANTLFFRSGQLIGDTTDVPGFLADLRCLVPTPPEAGSKALILGAGGSARAVAVALHEAGWQVILAARRVEQANGLTISLGSPFRILSLRTAALREVGDIRLLVNTTPVGMYPNVQECPWPEELPLPDGAAVYDLIYNPAETVLLRRARSAGLPARNGMGMLIEQAALSLEIWAGWRVPRAAMWAAVEHFSQP